MFLKDKVLWFVTMLVFAGMMPAGEDEGAQAQPLPGRSGGVAVQGQGSGSFVADEILVKVKPGVSVQALDKVSQQHNARVEKKIPRSQFSVVKLPKGLPVTEAVKLYRASPEVEYAEPDYILTPDQTAPVTPADPDYPKMYNLNNLGQTGGTPDADIDAPEAWNKTVGSPGVVVAVIDTDVDIDHPDLKGNIWVNKGEIPGNNLDDDNNGYVDDVNGWDFYNNDATVYDAADGKTHGTHVAGTIAAEGSNGTGITGVSWNAKIMPLKFIGPTGGKTSDAIEALTYAVNNGATISNNSWGGGNFSQALLDAIRAADTAGHLFVSSAGNGGTDSIGDNTDIAPHYPSGYDSPNIISVGASNNTDALAGFSNYGPATVDLTAPGVGILSLAPGGLYRYASGTSMAAPHVSGVAALIKSKYPDLDDGQLKARILGSVDRKPNLQSKVLSGGRLNADATLQTKPTQLYSMPKPTVVSLLSATELAGKLTYNGAGLSGKQVILEQSPAGTTGFYPVPGQPAGGITTGPDGSFSLTGVKPNKNTVYRARFAGDTDAAFYPSSSTPIRVGVRPLIYTNVSSAYLKQGNKVTISGILYPGHSGWVRMVIHRNGVIVGVRTLPLNASRYSFTYYPPGVGNYSVSISFPGDTDHFPAAGPTRSFRVVR